MSAVRFNGHATDGCDFPNCSNPATLILAFTCGHHLCKVHEYFWSQALTGETCFGNDRAEAPDGVAFGCSACAQGVARRQTEAEATDRAKAIFAPKETV